jgi:hypothetical protein
MNIEKNQIFKLSESPLVVGVVTGRKCSEYDRWYVKTTLGDVAVWNNKTQTWRGNPDFAPLSPANLLTNAPVCCGGCDCGDKEDLVDLELSVGDVWETTEGDRVVILESDVFEDDEDTEDPEVHPFVAVYLDKKFDYEYVNIYGKALNDALTLEDIVGSVE